MTKGFTAQVQLILVAPFWITIGLFFHRMNQ
jgi:hypothetical protein